jgi:protein-disulfide isomerase
MSGKSEREKRRQERLDRESEAGANERRQRLIKLGSAAAFLAVVVVAVLVVVSQSGTDGGDSSLEAVAEVESELSGIPQEALIIGKPDAPVRMVEFGDLQCPVCRDFAVTVLPDLIASKVRSGQARIEFRNWAILGEESEAAAEAAVAAGEQGSGWNFIELFYRNQGIEHSGYITDDFLTSVAEGAGVADISQWNKDRASPGARQEVERTGREAEQVGFEGTPSFAIEGPGSEGLEPFEAGTLAEFEAAIEGAA